MPTDLKDREAAANDDYRDDGWYSRQSGDGRSAEQAEQRELEKREQNAEQQQNQQSQKSGNRYTNAAKRITSSLKGNKSKNPLILILIALFGGGSIITAIFAPGVTLLSLADTLERDLNSQLSAMTKSTDQLWRSKLKATTSGSCGAVTLKCKFQTVNPEKFNKALATANSTSRGHLSAVYDTDSNWMSGRKKITHLQWVDQNGQTHKLDAKNFTDMTKTDLELRKTMMIVANPRFHAFKLQTTLDFLKKNKTSYAKKLTGNTEDEVRDSKEKARKGVGAVRFTEPRAILDEDGNETGRYEDPDTGRELTAEEADSARRQQELVGNSEGTTKMLSTLGKGAMITGVVDSACTVYNMSRAVVAGAKLYRSQELIRYSMIYTNEAHAIRANLSTPESVKVASDDIMYAEPKNEVADETKLAQTPAGEKLPMIENPNGGKTGMDSPIYKLSSNQDIPKKLNAETQAMMPGGGFTGTLSGINTAIANVLGASDPKTLSERCQIVQNPFVRTGALVIGIAAGLGSFGLSTAASIGGSTLISMALPYLAAQLSDMAAGNVTKDLKGIGTVSAIAIGSGLMYNGFARSNGLMSMSPERMAKYQNGKREAYVSYDEIDQYAAKDNPFDVTNKFSFLGSLTRTTLPAMNAAKSSGAGVVSAISSLPSLAISAILPTTKAADERQTLVTPDRYKQCNDPDYAALGDEVSVDATCVMVFGLPDEAMAADPEDIIDWMVANKEIDPSSDSGEPIDNDNDWNYKKYTEQCIDQQPGAAEDLEAEPTNGAGCVSKANFNKNWRYAKFRISIEADNMITQETPGMEGGTKDEFGDGSTSDVSEDGWAYPTDKNNTTFTSGLGPRGGTQHNGIDLAGPLGTPIYAARDGKVIAAGPASGFGNWIVIQHEADGQRVDTVYGHMAASGVLVSRGDEVKAGQMIGRIGNEGQSTGPHLHFEIWQGGHRDFGGGNAIDPKPIVDAASSGGDDA